MSTAVRTAAAPVPRLRLSFIVSLRARRSLVATPGARVPAVAAALGSVRAGSASAAIVQRRRCAFAVGAAHNPSVERTANGGLRLLALPRPAAPSPAAHLERYAPAMHATVSRSSLPFLGFRMSTAARTAAPPVLRAQLSFLAPLRAHRSLFATQGPRVPTVAAALRSVRAGSASAALVQRRRSAFAVGAAHTPSVERTANGGLRLLALPKPVAPLSAAHLER